MLKTFGVAALAALMVTGAAAADPIEGRWRTEPGAIAQIASCGGSFCVKLVSGKHSGKQIGTMSAQGGNSYKGTITDPTNDKTYKGDVTLSGNSLKMQGCVMAVICRSQNWKRM